MTTHTFLRAADIPPSAEQLQLLEYVRAHPRCLAGEAARALGWATWQVTSRMQSLYIKGFVERVRSDGAGAGRPCKPMACCTRLQPCVEAQRLWSVVADAHHAWTRTDPRFWRARSGRQRAYEAAQSAFEAHFVEAEVEQGAMPL